MRTPMARHYPQKQQMWLIIDFKIQIKNNRRDGETQGLPYRGSLHKKFTL